MSISSPDSSPASCVMNRLLDLSLSFFICTMGCSQLCLPRVSGTYLGTSNFYAGYIMRNAGLEEA